jgi:SpoVK/Ycf46/Vps4 family AAA+-type ATPase
MSQVEPQDMNAMYSRGLVKGLLKDKEGALSDLSLVLLELGVFDMPLLIVSEDVSESIIEDAKALYQSVSTKDKALSEAQAELEEINKDLKDTLKVLLEDRSTSTETNENSPKLFKKTELVNGRITHAGYCVPNERLSDVQGLEKVKETMWNNVVLPILRPDLYSKYKKKRSSRFYFTVLPAVEKRFWQEH